MAQSDVKGPEVKATPSLKKETKLEDEEPEPLPFEPIQAVQGCCWAPIVFYTIISGIVVGMGLGAGLLALAVIGVLLPILDILLKKYAMWSPDIQRKISTWILLVEVVIFFVWQTWVIVLLS